jgi:hypothetical protein
MPPHMPDSFTLEKMKKKVKTFDELVEEGVESEEGCEGKGDGESVYF